MPVCQLVTLYTARPATLLQEENSKEHLGFWNTDVPCSGWVFVDLLSVLLIWVRNLRDKLDQYSLFVNLANLAEFESAT